MSDIRFNRWLHQSGTGGVYQNSSGNVGIGSSVPTSSLDINGNLNVGAGGTVITTTLSGSVGVGTTNPRAAKIAIHSGSLPQHLTFDTSNATGGSIVFQTNASAYGDVGSAFQVFGSGSATDFGINARPSSALVFGTSNSERVRITGIGSVGIGTTTPATSLDVIGSIKGVITSGTSQVSTAGTSIDFTGIPSWVKRVTVMFNGVSTNGTSNYLLQLGTASGVENTNYISSSGALITASSGAGSSTVGFLLTGTGPEAAGLYSGLLIVASMTGNIWALSGNLGSASNSRTFFNAGSKSLAATLDRVRITTVNGTDTFDAGSINILYEG